MSDSDRDHLFVSYAWEDSALAEWLTLKLTSAGYRVWCDRIKLLGGESYPRDIDLAIKNRTFRLLAILSTHSLHKANPLKERTLALNLARARKIDFLIPLNLGVAAADLDWMTSDLTYVPFQGNWAQGLHQLLKKLTAIDAPRPLQHGPQVVAEWAAAQDRITDSVEVLWSNAFQFTSVPEFLYHIDAGSEDPAELFGTVPHYGRQGRSIWSFELPIDRSLPNYARLRTVKWRERQGGPGPDLEKIVVNLLRQYVRRRYLTVGLQEHEESSRRRHPYFVSSDGEDRWLHFDSYTGRRTRVKVVGRRTFRKVGKDGPERSVVNYHLSPAFIPNLHLLAEPVLFLQLHLFLTDEHGAPLSPKLAHRRRKRLTKNWFNHQWLSRMLATVQNLATDVESAEIQLALTQDCQITLSKTPIRHEVLRGINEDALATGGLDEAAAIEEDEDDSAEVMESDEDIDTEDAEL